MKSARIFKTVTLANYWWRQYILRYIHKKEDVEPGVREAVFKVYMKQTKEK